MNSSWFISLQSPLCPYQHVADHLHPLVHPNFDRNPITFTVLQRQTTAIEMNSLWDITRVIAFTYREMQLNTSWLLQSSLTCMQKDYMLARKLSLNKQSLTHVVIIHWCEEFHKLLKLKCISSHCIPISLSWAVIYHPDCTQLLSHHMSCGIYVKVNELPSNYQGHSFNPHHQNNPLEALLILSPTIPFSFVNLFNCKLFI